MDHPGRTDVLSLTRTAGRLTHASPAALTRLHRPGLHRPGLHQTGLHRPGHAPAGLRRPGRTSPGYTNLKPATYLRFGAL